MDLPEFKILFDMLESFFTIVGIILAGFWTYVKFIKKREKYPRASINHRIVEKELPNNKKLIHLFVEIENISDVLLRLVSYDVRISQVLPLSNELSNKLSGEENLFCEDDTELPWSILLPRTKKFKKGSHEVEPLEKQDFNFDVIVEKDIKTIHVYSYFKNESKTKREIGWNRTTFHDLK